MRTYTTKVEFALGGIFGGRTYYYTAFPTFRTLDEAKTYQASRLHRAPQDVIFERIDLGWGLKLKTHPAT